MASALEIEQGTIVAERRFHDVASTRRCTDRAQLPDGWWTKAVIAPNVDRVTGTVAVAGQRIEMHNGNSDADELVRWAVGRFLAADLPAPTVASVSFNEEAHRAECSNDERGMALNLGSVYRIYVCHSVDSTSAANARPLMLHELAHVWMWQNVRGPTQQEFLARMELSTWDALDVPWSQRGFELAADVIAWGLTDEPVTTRLLTGRSGTDLVEAFRLLTGRTPLATTAPSSVAATP